MIIQNNLRSSIICCLFSGGMYISSSFSFGFSFSFSFDLLKEVILSAILFPIKSPSVSNFGNFLHFYLYQQLFFVLPNNFIVSGVDNSSLQPFFILKTILFFILFGYICTEEFLDKVSCFLMVNSK